MRQDRTRWGRCSQLVGGAHKHRAFGTKVAAKQSDLGLAFSEPSWEATYAGVDDFCLCRKAPLPKPARRDRLWSGPTLFKRAEVLYEIDASTHTALRDGKVRPVYRRVKQSKKTLTGPTLRVYPTPVSRIS